MLNFRKIYNPNTNTPLSSIVCRLKSGLSSNLWFSDDVHGFKGKSHVCWHVSPDEVLKPRLSSSEQESATDHHNTTVHSLLHLVWIWATTRTQCDFRFDLCFSFSFASYFL